MIVTRSGWGDYVMVAAVFCIQGLDTLIEGLSKRTEKFGVGYQQVDVCLLVICFAHDALDFSLGPPYVGIYLRSDQIRKLFLIRRRGFLDAYLRLS